MSLFSRSQMETINDIAKKSHNIQSKAPAKKVSSINDELNASTQKVLEYFKDSPAILIQDKAQLDEYIDKAIESGYVGIDTETTGLDRNSDYIVGASLYYPGGVECYIPLRHRIPIFEDEYKNQLSYEDVADSFSKFLDSDIKMIYANANFDLYMISKDLGVVLDEKCYYDVILAWRCIQEDEEKKDLKSLYNKYVLEGKGDPKRFSDFFTPSLFPYCKPEVAKLYAANDARITFELFKWQLPRTIKSSDTCQELKLEHISDLIWNVEFPIISICQQIERAGMYIDLDTAKALQTKYHALYDDEVAQLRDMVQDAIDKYGLGDVGKKLPFSSGDEFNARSTLHVKHLLYNILALPKPSGKESTGRDVLAEFKLPITDKIIDVRGLATNISTFVDKLPNAVSGDGKIHADFKQIGAATGRLSSANPNLMNIPSKLDDIRHMFRADPAEFITKDCDVCDNNLIHISLSLYDSIKGEDGEYIMCKSAKDGGTYILNKDGEETSVRLHHKVSGVGRCDLYFESVA